MTGSYFFRFLLLILFFVSFFVGVKAQVVTLKLLQDTTEFKCKIIGTKNGVVYFSKDTLNVLAIDSMPLQDISNISLDKGVQISTKERTNDVINNNPKYIYSKDDIEYVKLRYDLLGNKHIRRGNRLLIAGGISLAVGTAVGIFGLLAGFDLVNFASPELADNIAFNLNLSIAPICVGFGLVSVPIGLGQRRTGKCYIKHSNKLPSIL